jgi:hypothetical protein
LGADVGNQCRTSVVDAQDMALVRRDNQQVAARREPETGGLSGNVRVALDIT